MQDLNHLNAFLQNLSTKASNLAPILYHTQDAMFQLSMDSFDKEADAFGNPWKPTKSLKNRKFKEKENLAKMQGSQRNITGKGDDGVNKVSHWKQPKLCSHPSIWRQSREWR